MIVLAVDQIFFYILLVAIAGDRVRSVTFILKRRFIYPFEQ